MFGSITILGPSAIGKCVDGNPGGLASLGQHGDKYAIPLASSSSLVNVSGTGP